MKISHCFIVSLLLVFFIGDVAFCGQVRFPCEKEIVPFETNDTILMPPMEKEVFLDRGFHIEAAAHQLMVYFQLGITTEQLSEFMSTVHSYEACCVGQIPELKIVQIYIEKKDALLELKQELQKFSFIKMVKFNRVSGIDVFE